MTIPKNRLCCLCGSGEDVQPQGGLFKCKPCRDKLINDKIQKIIPPQFLNLQSEHPKLQQYINDPKSLFLWGKSGTGKTTFACNLAREYLKAGLHVVFISYPKFIMQLQGGFDSQTSPYEVAKDIAGFKGVLFIDDIGAEKLTPFVQQITYYLINEREQYLLTTVITSNFSLQQIAEQVDVRIASRISGMCDILQFTGKDMRVKNG